MVHVVVPDHSEAEQGLQEENGGHHQRIRDREAVKLFEQSINQDRVRYVVQNEWAEEE